MKECGTCKQRKTQADFSEWQWRKEGTRWCQACSEKHAEEARTKLCSVCQSQQVSFG